jgi:hypothetical protein
VTGVGAISSEVYVFLPHECVEMITKAILHAHWIEERGKITTEKIFIRSFSPSSARKKVYPIF